MYNFRKYRRISTAELRRVTIEEIEEGLPGHISLSEADRLNGSPRSGDMIARNPENYDDQWLVAERYFLENFEEIT